MNYRKRSLVCQDNLNHTMWGVKQIIESGVHCDIRPYTKSAQNNLNQPIIFTGKESVKEGDQLLIL
jgi:hypothetical protein